MNVSDTENSTTLSSNCDFHICRVSLASVGFGSALSVPILLFGIFGNIITLIILWKTKTPTNQSTKLKYIHLSIADLLALLYRVFMLVATQLTAILSQRNVALIARLLPYMGLSISHFPSAVSSLMVMYLALERVVAVAVPLKVRIYCSESIVKILIAMTYVISACICAAKAAQYKIVEVNSDFLIYETFLGGIKGLYAFIDGVILVLFYIIPIIVAVVCSIILALSLYSHTKSRTLVTKNIQSAFIVARRRKNLQITRNVFLVTLLFIVCVTPAAIFRTYASLGYTDNFFVRNGSKPVFLLITMNHSLNFLLYILMIPDYRRAFVHLFSKRQEHHANSKE